MSQTQGELNEKLYRVKARPFLLSPEGWLKNGYMDEETLDAVLKWNQESTTEALKRFAERVNSFEIPPQVPEDEGESYPLGHLTVVDGEGEEYPLHDLIDHLLTETLKGKE